MPHTAAFLCRHGTPCPYKENSHTDKEDSLADKEDSHTDKEDFHTDKEDSHADKETERMKGGRPTLR